MIRQLKKHTKTSRLIELPASKSITNRMLILRAIFPGLTLTHISEAEDSEFLQLALDSVHQAEINVGEGGTTMRFLLALLSARPGVHTTLYGSKRLHQRPVAPLVEALRNLGADLTYADQEGFLPIRIKGRKLKGGHLVIQSSSSSQFISALLLASPLFIDPLEIELEGTIVSRPYITMTLDCLKQVGIPADCEDRRIVVRKSPDFSLCKTVTIEPDWSSASFWYAWCALQENSRLVLSGLSIDSIQGDKKLADYYEALGVRTRSTSDGLEIRNTIHTKPARVSYNLLSHPDLAPPLAVSCAALGIETWITGLQTLVLKESNRLEALKEELLKFGVDSEITEDSIHIPSQEMHEPRELIRTHNDHRITMSFAVLSSRYNLEIEDPDNVRKSYPAFWEMLEK